MDPADDGHICGSTCDFDRRSIASNSSGRFQQALTGQIIRSPKNLATDMFAMLFCAADFAFRGSGHVAKRRTALEFEIYFLFFMKQQQDQRKLEVFLAG
jgi:hypothetical protein